MAQTAAGRATTGATADLFTHYPARLRDEAPIGGRGRRADGAVCAPGSNKEKPLRGLCGHATPLNSGNAARRCDGFYTHGLADMNVGGA